MGRLIDLETDFEQVLATYLHTMDKVDDIASRYLGYVSRILFSDPGFGIEEAARLLEDDGFTVERKGDALFVKWHDGPVLKVNLSRGMVVQQMAVEISKDSLYETDLKKCDACFSISFDDLEEVLDEMNTLGQTQWTLQSATGGFLFNTWNGYLRSPDELY